MWKQNTENSENSTYVKTSGTKVLNDGSRRLYYLCHRALKCYNKISEENRKRSKKAVGSNKIGKACPSAMVATLYGKKVWVKYVKTHLGHACELGRQKISKRDKKEIVAKLLSGMTFDEVIKSVRDGQQVHSKRALLLVKKDLHNIMRDYLNNSERFLEDCPADDCEMENNSWDSCSMSTEYEPETDVYNEELLGLEFKPEVDHESSRNILTESNDNISEQPDIMFSDEDSFDDSNEFSENCQPQADCKDRCAVSSDSCVVVCLETADPQLEETIVPSFNAILQQKTALLHNLISEVNITDQYLATSIKRRLDVTIEELHRIINPNKNSQTENSSKE